MENPELEEKDPPLLKNLLGELLPIPDFQPDISDTDKELLPHFHSFYFKPLWIHIKLGKESYVGYTHAWGYCWVSDDKKGKNVIPVEYLKFSLSFQEPIGNGWISDEVTKKRPTKKANADAKFWGTIIPDLSFDLHYSVEMKQSGFKPFKLTDKWS